MGYKMHRPRFPNFAKIWEWTPRNTKKTKVIIIQNKYRKSTLLTHSFLSKRDNIEITRIVTLI